MNCMVTSAIKFWFNRGDQNNTVVFNQEEMELLLDMKNGVF